MSAGNSVDLQQDPRSIIATHVLDAPRELVFAVWSDPKHLSQWWGPNGFTTTTRAHEFRKGGVWRFVMHGPDGRDYENRITYDEIVKPERLVYSHGGGDDVEPVRFQVTVSFEDLGDKTKLTTAHGVPVGGRAHPRDRNLRSRQGLVQTLARLADHVAAMAEKS